MSSPPTASRLLTLLSLLQGRREWSGGELAERLGVTDRTVRRDMDRLRRLGYPVDSVSGQRGGYRLRAGTAMPPLLLDDDEAVAIAVSLRTGARVGVQGMGETALRALVKLEQLLPAHLRRRVQALGAATSTLPDRRPGVDPEHLTLLAAACRDGERVRFDYLNRTGLPSRRDVEPHHLVHYGAVWYLIAWDTGRDDWRTFRIDRLARPTIGLRRFTPRAIPGGDPVAYVTRARAALPHRHRAHILLWAPADRMADHPHLWGTVEPVDEGRCLYRTGDDDLDWLAMRVAALGVDFRVLEPPELRERLERLGRRVERSLEEPA